MVKIKTILPLIDDLNPRQKKTMKSHAKHHTKKHISAMVTSIKKGKTFTEAHNLAMRKVGK
jgi:hypothetical protein